MKRGSVAMAIGGLEDMLTDQSRPQAEEVGNDERCGKRSDLERPGGDRRALTLNFLDLLDP
ncbi:hypothetical protein ACHAWO_013910 [Cyclotella atomus]|uniref:Uncharacterized protein n=1 Tax=Cyclotella atomus TaxID=382360 RepID=A0ABD3QRS8_9STRA